MIKRIKRRVIENDNDLLEFLRVIKKFIHENDRFPTLQEIAEEIDYSIWVAQSIIAMLEDKGFIMWQKHYRNGTVKMQWYPMIWSVKAWPPDNLFDMDTEEFIDIEKELVDDPANTFVVQVSGDSLIDVGIHDGSYVTIQRDPSPHIGSLVYALVDGEYTLKFYHLTNGKVELHPGNTKYDPISKYETLDIVWVCIGYFNRVPKG